jgi:hypothetical protein
MFSLIDCYSASQSSITPCSWLRKDEEALRDIEPPDVWGRWRIYFFGVFGVIVAVVLPLLPLRSWK